MGETSPTNFSGSFFLEPSMPYASEALRKGNVNKCLESAAVDQAVFAIQLSILNRMSFLPAFSSAWGPTPLMVLALSL